VILNSPLSVNSQITNLTPLCDKKEQGILLGNLHIPLQTREYTTVIRRGSVISFSFFTSFLSPPSSTLLVFLYHSSSPLLSALSWYRHHFTKPPFCNFLYSYVILPFKYEAQTALFKDPVRTAQ
jgi:hypothetical protein